MRRRGNTMSNSILWNSPRLPDSVADDDDIAWEVRTKVEELSAVDSPSSSDMAKIFHRYNSSSRAERDAIDAAFVWMTGYTLASICAMVVTPEGKDFERTLEKWRKAGS